MQTKNELSKLDAINAFIEKWTLIFLLLALYLAFSFKVIHDILYPYPSARECGTGFFAVLMLQVFFAGIILAILFFAMFRHAKYARLHKAIAFFITVIPVSVSFLLF